MCLISKYLCTFLAVEDHGPVGASGQFKIMAIAMAVIRQMGR